MAKQAGRTRARTHPLQPQGKTLWQQHPQPIDPLTAARNVRKKKR